MITHEEAKKRIELGFKDYIGLSSHTINKWKNELLDYISQQEKVTELLGLYREKSDLLVQIANGKYLQDDYMKLLEKIEQLEKDLGEMK